MGVEQSLPEFVNSWEVNIAGFSFPAKYVYAGVFLFLVFLLVLMMARVRRHFVDWSIKGSIIGILIGFVLALVLEGFLILAGRNAITEILGWKSAPEPLLVVLDSGRQRVSDLVCLPVQTDTSEEE